MGGVAALARELGHDVEGSDQAIYPPMSTQLEQLGIDLAPGLLGRQRIARRLRRGRGRQRAVARQRRGRARARRTACVTPRARSGCARHVLPGRDDARRRRHARQDHHHHHPRLPARSRGPRSGLPDRRRGRGFRRVRARGQRPRVRRRGRRVRHRVLRQAQQVRALPADGGDPQQPRIRPRRHLPRRRRDPAPVPPPGAHRAAARPADRQRRGRAPRRSAGDGLLDAGGDLRPGRCRPERQAVRLDAPG